MASKQLQQKRLKETKVHALHLMDELGRKVLGKPLQELGWTFAFDNAKRRLGLCRYRPGKAGEKRISLSRHYVRLNGLQHVDENGLQVIEDVIRHEIAHAIDNEQRGASDHSATWKKVCRLVGADPTRLYEGKDTHRMPGKYESTCPKCGNKDNYYRRPKLDQYCKTCNVRDGRRFDDAYRLELHVRATGELLLYGKERKKAALKQVKAQSKSKGPTPAEQGYKYTGTCSSCGYQRGFRRTVKRTYACRHCCAAYAGGKYDERFKLRIKQNY